MLTLLLLAPLCSGATAIENVHIVDPMSGSIARKQTIVVDGRKITALLDGPAPTDMNRIDGRGRYAIPPLINAHAHIFDARDLETFAAYGVLLVRNLDGWSWHLTINNDDAGSAPRARIVSAGSQLQDLDSVGLANRFARETDYPWVKVYDDVDSDALKQIGSLAKQAGRRVTGHLPDSMDPYEAIESGVFHDVAHVEEILPHGLRRLTPGAQLQRIRALGVVLRDANVAVTTTLVTNDRAAEMVELGYRALERPAVADAAPVLQAFWQSSLNPFASAQSETMAKRMRADLAIYHRAIGAWNHAGVQLLPGTDAPSPGVVPGADLLRELALWETSGISPADVVRLATVQAARYLTGVDTTLQPAAAANFLLLDRNPLESSAHFQTLSTVVQEGVVYGEESIEAGRKRRRETFAMERHAIGTIDPSTAEGVIARLTLLKDIAKRRDLVLSLSWMYLKFGNTEACQTLQEPLEARQRPGCR